MKKIYILSVMTMFLNCKNNNVENFEIQTDTLNTTKSEILNNSNNILSVKDSLFFTDNDSINISIVKSNNTTIDFSLKVKKYELTGKANLVLEEDNGKFYIPEGTPILDEKTNQEFNCDSTYTFDSKNINLTFAIETNTKNRLSFI